MKLLLPSAAVLLMSASLPALANESVTAATGDSKNWAIQTGDYANTRYSELDQINKDNVGDLQVAWTFSTGVLRGHEGSPLVIGDMMYVHTPFPNIVYALDLTQDGKIVWKYEPKQDPNVIPVMCCDTVNRGLAYADGKIFLHQADTTVVALDAKTGEVKWTAVNGDPTKGETNTATVLPVKDKVIVGISGGEFGVRGHVTAYDMNDGQAGLARLFDRARRGDAGRSREDDGARQADRRQFARSNSWEGDQWQIGGGTTWGWYTYDPELDLVYYGTGNPSTWNPAQRPGDNKWSMTIFARDPDNGMAKWALPDDAARRVGLSTASTRRSSSTRRSTGRRASCSFHFDRNGLGYTLDRETGELLVAEKYDPAVNWTTGVDMDPNSETFGRPAVVPEILDRAERRGREHRPASARRRSAPRTSSRRPSRRRPGCSTCRPTTSAWTTSRSGSATPRASPTSARRCRCTRRRTATAAWATSSPGTPTKGEIKWSLPEQFSVWSGALATAGRRGVLRHARGLPEGGRRRDGRGALQVQDPVGHHRQRDDLRARRQAVRRHPVGRRRLGRHRPRGGPHVPGERGGVADAAGRAAAGRALESDERNIDTAGLGAVGGYAALTDYTALGGQLTVFALPD